MLHRFVVLALLGACAGPQRTELSVSAVAELAPPTAFPGAAAILHGFDVRRDGDWCAGDEVLFGLRLHAAGSTRQWLLHLRLTEPAAIARAGDEVPERDLLPPLRWTLKVNDVDRNFTSARCRVLATVYDAEGNVLGRSEPLLPRDFLATGFTGACDVLTRWQREGRQEPARRSGSSVDASKFAHATVAAIALLQVVQEDSVLAPLLWEVLERPSWWSVLQNFGARLLLQPAFDEAEPMVVVHGPTTMTWRVPITLSVNDQKALVTHLYVASAARPQALCGGIVGGIARNPHDGGRELGLVLLAARCAR